MSEEEKRRGTSSNLKIAMSSVITATVAAVFMLVGVFVIDHFSAHTNTGIEYWVERTLTAVATFMIMLSTANITEEARKKSDASYNDRMEAIDTHYKQILGNGETDSLEKYIENTNRVSKYRAYVQHYKRKIKHTRNVKKRKKYETCLLLSPDEVWEDVERIKYHKITFSQLFEGAIDVSAKDDDNDLNIHRGRAAFGKLVWKFVCLAAFGAVTADIAFTMQDFDKSMVVTLLLKVAVMLVAAYSGVSFGYNMLERTKVVLKRKTRILSAFRARCDKNEGFDVEIPKDIYIEKLKAAQAKTPAAEPEHETAHTITSAVFASGE